MSRYAFIQFAFIMFSCGWSSRQNKFQGFAFLFIPCCQKINKTNFLYKRFIINIKMPSGSYNKNGTLKGNSSVRSKIFLIPVVILYFFHFQLCSYYVDPQNCLGPVAASPVAGSREFTAGEKRLASHPDFLHFNQIKTSLCLAKNIRRTLLEIIRENNE